MQVALITGAARRIGAALAERLHPRYNLILHYNHSREQAESLVQQLNSARADSATALQADFNHLNQVEALGTAAIEQWGRVDGVVNNASTFYDTPLGSVGESDWDQLIAGNLKAHFFLLQQLSQQLRQNQGWVVNLTDAKRAYKHRTPYAAAKEGLAGITRSLARELAPDVRVNAVAPGIILWPEQGMSQVEKDKALTSVALGRTGSVEEIAAAVDFLTSASYITGQILRVDGGLYS